MVLITVGSILDQVLGAANASNAAAQTVRVNEDLLDNIFLFVGILSGRGYRHRRLAGAP